MVVLGVVKRRGRNYLGRNLTEARTVQCLLENCPGLLGQPGLLLIKNIDAGAVLGAAIIALPHTLGRIVSLPENLEQFFI